MIAIIGPMAEELAVFYAKTPKLRRGKGKCFTYSLGDWDGQQIVLMQCGIGKVNAAAATQYLLHAYPVTAVVLQGVAGGVNPSLKTGDTIIADMHIHHDMDATALGFAPGQIPFTELREFRADPALLARIRRSCEALALPHRVGRIVSGDRFIADSRDVARLRLDFGAEAVDMEGAAVAQVCALHGIPFLSIKTISDGADNGAAKDFSAFIKRSSEQLYTILRHSLKGASHHPVRAARAKKRRTTAARSSPVSMSAPRGKTSRR